MSKPPKKAIKIVANKDIQRAIDMFPKIVKRNAKTALEKARIRKNFLTLKDVLFPESEQPKPASRKVNKVVKNKKPA